jgi:hypothetical protein
MAMNISSIIIEALARRAKSLVEGMHGRVNRDPDVADFRTAFVDELKRFENSNPNDTATPAQVQAQVLAKFPPANKQSSRGYGLGQQTGGTALSDGQEARRLLAMICPCGIDAVTEVCGSAAAEFVKSQSERSNAIVTHYAVTGKQLYWLRDIKDKLVERGLL